jgi:hypothetical protein
MGSTWRAAPSTTLNSQQSTVNKLWLQSPVLPRTRRAFETHLSAGSIAKTVNESVKFELVNWLVLRRIR